MFPFQVLNWSLFSSLCSLSITCHLVTRIFECTCPLVHIPSVHWIEMHFVEAFCGKVPVIALVSHFSLPAAREKLNAIQLKGTYWGATIMLSAEVLQWNQVHCIVSTRSRCSLLNRHPSKGSLFGSVADERNNGRGNVRLQEWVSLKSHYIRGL